MIKGFCGTVTKRPGSLAGFTLMELLVTVGVIALLAAILLPTVNVVIAKGEEAQAKSEVQSIAVAVEAYYNEYGKLPIPDGDHGPSDQVYSGSGSKNIIEALLGETGGSIPNPRGISFLKSQNETNDGTFEDPWNTQYILKMDGNYNGKLSYTPVSSETLSHRVIVISVGPDGIQGDPTTDDDIVSHLLK